MTAKRTCPECGSDECKKASLVHEEGGGTVRLVGIGSGGVGIAGGVTQSKLAKRVAPPPPVPSTRKGQGLMIFCLLISGISIFTTVYLFGVNGGLGVFGTIWNLLWIGLVIWSGKRMMKNPLSVDQRMIDYNNTYMCLRCGTCYMPFVD